jgi:conjugative relaxase-like TrwC/TraI family protein
VLRIHPVRGEGHRYYTDDLVPGRAEGSRVAGESPGVWTGGGAATLGLDGTVHPEAFRQVLEGLDPRSGDRMRRLHGGQTVSGFDLTFCAPKSVSLLHLLAPTEIAAQAGAGHHAAVEEATDYLAQAAVGVRRQRDGVVGLLPATGPVAGHFVHRTSRALDPHLHSHLVVANVAQGVDGHWSALDSRRLFAHAPTVQAVYHARLRLELTTRLGAAWQVPPSGLGDVVGVDARLRRLFSTRSASMDEYDHARNRVGRGAGRSRGGFHATRPDKDRSHSVEGLTGQWRTRASDFGIDLGDLTRTVGLGRRSGAAGGPPFDPERIGAHLSGLVERGRPVLPHQLVAAVAVSTSRGATVGQIESVAAGIAGACRNVGRTSEPRWSAADVLRVVGDRPELLGPSEGHSLDRRGWDVEPASVRSSARERPTGRATALDVEAGVPPRELGHDLGR